MTSYMKDEFWVHLSSNADTDDLYPDNRPDKFTVRLPIQLPFFNKKYKVALWYISIPTFWNVINDKNKRVLLGRRKMKTVKKDVPFHIKTFTIEIPAPPSQTDINVNPKAGSGDEKDEESEIEGKRDERSVEEESDDDETKRFKRDYPDFVQSFTFKSGGLLMHDYVTWFKHHIPVEVQPYFDITSRNTGKDDKLKKIEITFVHKGDSAFTLHPDFTRFWKSLGIRDDDIDVPHGNSLKFETSKYIRFRPTRPRIITVRAGIPATKKDVRVEVVEEEPFDLPVGFFDNPNEFLDNLSGLPAQFRNIFDIKDKRIVLQIPEDYELKLNKGLAQLFGFPPDTWIKGDGELIVDGNRRYHEVMAGKIFTCHPVTQFYLYTNLITPQITSHKFTPVLYELVPHRGNDSISYLSDSTPHHPPQLLYKDVLSQSVSELTFVITDQLGNEIDFIHGNGETSVILHFKKDE
jgi:hypothetical protein